MRRLLLLLACGILGCEPDPVATQPWPVMPRSYANPSGYQQWGAPPPAPPPPTPLPAPPANPYKSAWAAQRNFDMSLDVPPGVAGASSDVGDPWAAPKAGASPTTYVVVLLALDKKGNQNGRAAAARKLLAAHGAVKRSEMVWEFPSAQADLTPAVLKTELGKVLCDEDRATLLFAEGRALAKLEFAGTTACDGPASPAPASSPPKAPTPKPTRRDPSEVQ